MSLLAGAVVPAAPLLVNALAGGSADRDARLRADVLAAVAGLVAAGPGPLVVVGPAGSTGPRTGTWDWSGFGVSMAGRPGADPLPTALAIGAWLLDTCDAPAERTYLGVAEHEPAAVCARLGHDAVDGGDVRMLVVGDGSARRSAAAPGALDPRAEAFDQQAERALAAGDPDALLDLDPALGRDLLAAGRAPWQVLAGAAGPSRWDAVLRHSSTPYGVCYLVASWLPGAS